MTKKVLGMGVIALGLAFIIVSIVFFTLQQKSATQNPQTVKVHGGTPFQGDKIYIEPKTVWIDEGNCVFWANQYGTDDFKPEVKLVFEEDKKCEDCTDTPTEVMIGSATKVLIPQDCYVITLIPYSETTSLRFLEKGSYEYTVEGKEGVTERGKIVVK